MWQEALQLSSGEGGSYIGLLYNADNETFNNNMQIGGGVIGTSGVIKDSDGSKVYMVCPSDGSPVGVVTQKALDLTKYKKILFDIEGTGYYSGNGVGINYGIMSSLSNLSSDIIRNNISNSQPKRQILEIDLESLISQGQSLSNCYIFVYARGSDEIKGYVRRILLV